MKTVHHHHHDTASVYASICLGVETLFVSHGCLPAKLCLPGLVYQGNSTINW